MSDYRTLKEVFPDYLYNPIFFSEMTETPWYSEVSPQQLAIKYIGQRSGSKISSPLLDDIFENEETNILKVIANVLTACENERWSKLWSTMQFEYNPIENYNMKESSTDTRNTTDDTTSTGNSDSTTTDNVTNSGSDNVSRETSMNTTTSGTSESSSTVNDKMTHDDTIKDTENVSRETSMNISDKIVHDTSKNTTAENTSNTLDSVYGFNSDTAVNADNSKGTASGSTLELYTGSDTTTRTENGNDTTERTNNRTDSGSTTHDITNTGNTSESRTITETGNDNTITSSENTTKGTTTDTASNTVTKKTTGVDTNEHVLTRSGNIGVTTTQQMIQAERELWLWKFFDDVVFADIDKYLTCPIYK